MDTAYGTYKRELNDGLAVRAQSEIGHQVLGTGPATSAWIGISWPDGLTDCGWAAANTSFVVTRGSGC